MVASINLNRNNLEIKSISITRLKHCRIRRLPNTRKLEIKSISITRLKLSWQGLPQAQLSAWNQKYLDYEIETSFRHPTPQLPRGLKSKVSRLRDWNSKGTGASQSLWRCPWNQKYLDYEIETVAWLHLRRVHLHLKSKVSRLRDWNIDEVSLAVLSRHLILEIKSISITRLKLPTVSPRCEAATLQLEIKSISITRLKLQCFGEHRLAVLLLKSKVSRLRDWNWKCKLNSIVSLSLKSKVSRLRDWNNVSGVGAKSLRKLEIKSISITRLKHRDTERCGFSRLYWTWNQKYLDYEIETIAQGRDRRERPDLKSKVSRLRDWNCKRILCQIEKRRRLEIKSISITRLKRQSASARIYSPWRLKSKVSRLRDWNMMVNEHRETPPELEIKSISITRLKPRWDAQSRGASFPLEIKSISITRLKPRRREDRWSADYGLEIKSISITRLKPNERQLELKLNICPLEIKSISITRLKRVFRCVGKSTLWMNLKSKVSRLRDWNVFLLLLTVRPCPLEIKSISITRLKPHTHYHEKRGTEPWNQKYLDYEIETSVSLVDADGFPILKSKVSRLRDWNETVDVVGNTIEFTWNQKYLDYEIETRLIEATIGTLPRTWNQKYLDYEIETWAACPKNPANSSDRLEIKSISITRLKHTPTCTATKVRVRTLKSKVSRLRDWNINEATDAALVEDLKSKVSRLRDWNLQCCRLDCQGYHSWNQKYLDYEIETGFALIQWLTRLFLKSKVSRLRDWNN